VGSGLPIVGVWPPFVYGWGAFTFNRAVEIGHGRTARTAAVGESVKAKWSGRLPLVPVRPVRFLHDLARSNRHRVRIAPRFAELGDEPVAFGLRQEDADSPFKVPPFFSVWSVTPMIGPHDSPAARHSSRSAS
jgi:hypothetical protein